MAEPGEARGQDGWSDELLTLEATDAVGSHAGRVPGAVLGGSGLGVSALRLLRPLLLVPPPPLLLPLPPPLQSRPPSLSLALADAEGSAVVGAGDAEWSAVVGAGDGDGSGQSPQW
jgi:hypothetical protein